MTLTAAQQKLVARAKLYPFDPPSTSYLFAERACWNLHDYDLEDPGNASVEIEGILQPINKALVNHGYSPASLNAPRVPVLASGSNASPTRLREKFGSNSGQALIPVVKHQVLDILPVFSAKFASYGSITATLQYAPGSQSQMFVTYLSEPQLLRMHSTEAIGDEYHFTCIENVKIVSESGTATRGPVYAYLSIKDVFQVNRLQFTLREFKTNAPGEHFAARSQETMLKLAWKLLASCKDFETFIYENISNKNIRQQRNDRLRVYSTPFADSSVKIIEGSPTKLFKTYG